MTFTLEIVDLIILIGIFQGLFLTLVLQRISNTNKKANRVLSVLILICTIMLVGRVLMLRFFTLWVFQWSIIFDVILFLFGPMFYLYTKRLLLNDQNRNGLAIVHYIPVLGFLIAAVYYVMAYSPDEYLQAYRDGELTLMFHIWLVAGILSNLFYLVLSFRIIKAFRKSEKHNFSFDQNPLTFLTFFHYSILLILVVWIFSYVNSMWLNNYIEYIGYDILWIAIPVFIYVIGYYSLKQPELFRIQIAQDLVDSRERLPKGEAQMLKAKLDSLMQNEQVYLQNDLTLGDVARLLHTSTHNVSWVLNHSYGISFYDFVNGYRIREFIQKIDKKEHLKQTILALSMDVGFNSKSTFNKAFKQTMKDTPSNFIKKHSAA